MFLVVYRSLCFDRYGLLSWLGGAKVVEYRVGGSAIREQMVQMMMREMMTTFLVVLALRGFMTALLLSRVMASIVKTLADTCQGLEGLDNGGQQIF